MPRYMSAVTVPSYTIHSIDGAHVVAMRGEGDLPVSGWASLRVANPTMGARHVDAGTMWVNMDLVTSWQKTEDRVWMELHDYDSRLTFEELGYDYAPYELVAPVVNHFSNHDQHDGCPIETFSDNIGEIVVYKWDPVEEVATYEMEDPE